MEISYMWHIEESKAGVKQGSTVYKFFILIQEVLKRNNDWVIGSESAQLLWLQCKHLLMNLSNKNPKYI
jgi:hypothetical protein